MSITISIQCDNITAAQSILEKLGATSQEVTAEVVPVADKKSNAPTSGKGKGKPAKKAEPATEVTASEDDARNALMAIGKSHGMPAVTEILGKIGAKKVSEIPADKYAEVVGYCESYQPEA